MNLPTSQVELFALPFARPFVTATGTFTQRRGAVVALTQDGLTGQGEVSPLPGFSQETLEQALEQLPQALEHVTRYALPPDMSTLRRLVDEMARLGWHASVRFAIEVALLDRLAQAQGVPLARLLNPAHATRVPVNATLSHPEPDACAQGAAERLDQGFGAFKLKVGAGSPEQDAARARAVRRAIGPAAKLRLDANGAWTAPQAIELLSQLDDLNLDFVEQPVPPHDLEAMARVRAHVGAPIAADEGIRTRADLGAHIQAGACDVVVLKPALVGSLLQTQSMARAAQRAGLRVIVTTTLDAVVGRLAALHLCAALNLEDACGLATGSILARDLCLTKQLESIEAGHLPLPAGAGLGIGRLHAAPRRILNLPASSAPVIPLPLWQRAQHQPHKVALDTADGALTYAQLWARVGARAAAMRACGVGAHDPVGVWATNTLETVVTLHACMALGALLVPLHPTWEATQVGQQAARAQCVCVLTDQARAGSALPMPVYAMDALMSPEPDSMLQTEVSLHEPAAMLLTSGTTGQPKRVLLTWQNLVFSATGSAITLGHLPDDRWLCVLPVCHIAGLSILFRCALLGTTAVVPSGFDAKACAQAIASGEVTLASLVPTMLQDVLTHAQGRAPAFRAVLLGGGAISDELLERARDAGIPVAPTYGMTEASSQIATLPPWSAGPGVGGPLVWTQVRLSTESGPSASKEGRIEIKSPTCSPGYVEESAHVEYIGQNSRCLELSASPHWLDTGDWGRWDPDTAHLEILDRRTDLIVSGGENVSPQHVELVLQRHPDVARACVVGLPDPRWGAKVIAVVQTRGAQALPDLDAWCRAHLAPYEVPKQVFVWAELPTTALGKINRAHVRQRLLTLTSPLHS